MKALSATLEVSTGRILNGGGCKLHRELVKNLGSRDAIISFNYDCLIDDALRKAGSRKWNPRLGYAFPLGRRPILGLDKWRPPTPPRAGVSLRLLKLHGSLNWQFTDKAIRLKERLHQQRGTPRFDIIPPVWNKSFTEDGIYLRIWREAARRLRTAEVVAIIGFSFSDTDLYTQSLFRVALHRNRNLQRLIIVNPDPAARARTRAVFDEALLHYGLVRQYDKLAEFTDALPGAMT